MPLSTRLTEPLLGTSPEMELLFLRRLQDVRAEEGQDVCLEVETGRIDKAGAVRWVRGGEPLQADSRLSMAQESHIHRLVIHSVMLNDQGIYGCESHHDRTLARLSVRREYPVPSWCTCCPMHSTARGAWTSQILLPCHHSAPHPRGSSALAGL